MTEVLPETACFVVKWIVYFSKVSGFSLPDDTVVFLGFRQSFPTKSMKLLLVKSAILKIICNSATLQIPLVTICNTSLTFNDSTFCPHSVFMCFVWTSEQTAIISLYSINWLVCITETEGVYCAVRTGSLYIILRSAHTVYLCVLCGSENKQRLFPYIALTGWFCNRDSDCSLRGTRWMFK